MEATKNMHKKLDYKAVHRSIVYNVKKKTINNLSIQK